MYERNRAGIGNLGTLGLVESRLDFRIGTVGVVGQAVDDNRAAARAEAFIPAFCIAFVRAALGLVDRSLDDIGRNLVGLGFLDLSGEGQIHIRVRDAGLCCNIQFLTES